jgi:endonuclease/exonuclease/phosphatase (EEP) superfamily protein YafD
VPTLRAVAQKLRRPVIVAVVAVAGAASLASVAGFAGAWWWPFDLAANFRPQYAAGLALLAAVLLALRAYRCAIAFGLMALLNLVLVWPYLFGVRPGIADDTPHLEIVSFNVGISNPARDDVMEWLRSEDPDIVFLYESSFEWENSARAADLSLSFVTLVPDGRLAGITVLARPSIDARLVAVPFDARDAVAVSVDLDGKRLTVLGLHPLSPTNAGRAGARDRLLADAGDWVAAQQTPTVVIGDLNATPWSHAHRSLCQRGGLSDSLRGSGLQPTWKTGLGPLMIPIDHALYTRDLLTGDRRTGPSYGSDHRPLVFEVTWALGTAG